MNDFRSPLARILEAGDRHPDRPALSTRDGTISYRALIGRASHLAHRVQDRCPAGSRLAILTGDDTATYVSLVAAWMAGCAYVPVHRDNPPARMEEIVRQSEVGLVLGSAAHRVAAGTAERVGTEFLVPSNDEIMRDAPVHSSEADDVAYVLFTSGSTGRPKGVPITHGNLAAFFDAWADDDAFSLTPEDRVLQMFDLSFDLSVMSFFGPLCHGAACHVVPNDGIASLNVAKLLRDDRISFAVMVPSVMSYLHRYFDELRLPELRHCMFAGEALLHDLTAGWSRCAPNARIQNGYGPTEGTILATIYDWERDRSAVESHEGIVPIGRPMRGTEAFVLDEDDQEVAADEEGELCLAGPQVMRGYWNDEEKTRAAFVEVGRGPGERAYRTGDLVRRGPDGVIMWLMRKDFQVKIDGHRIELGEIESHARRIADTPNAVVMACPNDDGRPELTLFLEGSDPALTDAHLAEALSGALPPYMRPRWIRRLDNFPLTTSGKVDRNALTSMST